MNYLLHLLVMVEIYAMLTLSLNLLAGYAGLVALSHAAFYGLGAYGTTLLMMKANLGFWPALGLSVLLCGASSLSIAWPSLRLKGDYFLLATLGFQVIVFVVLYNWISLTRGPFGIPGIPRPSFLGFSLHSPGDMALFGAVLLGIVLLVVWALGHSPFGLALKTVREDEIAAQSLGYSTPRLKIWAFVLSSSLAALPGGLFAIYMRYIDPTSFTLMESVTILTALLIGGAGNLKGPVAGAAVMVFLPEALRFLPLSSAAAANLRQILYGALLIWMVLRRPRGLLGEYGLGER